MERGERGPRGDPGERGPRGDNGWLEHRSLIAYRLQELDDRLDKMETQLRGDHSAIVAQLSDVKSDIAALKVRAGFYGAVSGLAASLSVFITHWFTK